ncbi:unnamed protein product [Closterium sp. NIES-54]
METTVTKPPLPPAPTTAKADADILHLPEPGLQVVVAHPSAQADQQARTLLLSPHAAPAALPAMTADVPDSAAGPPAAVPSAPSAGVAPAIVAGAVTPKPAVCATIDLQPPGTDAGAFVPPTRATPASPLTGQVLSDPQRRQQSPARRPSRPHSPSPRNERETIRRRRDSPRRRQPQAGWLAHRGGRGGWRGGHGYGGGWGGADMPASIADVRQIVSEAIRDGRTGSASQSSSLQATPSPADPHRGVPPVVAPVAAEPLPAAAGGPASAPPRNAASARLRLPRVPPVAGMEFVSAGRGVVRAQYPPLVAVDPAPSVVDEALPYLAEGLLPPYIRDGPRDDCLDAADQLALLLAPVLAAPVRGGVGAVSQLDAAVRGLRR